MTNLAERKQRQQSYTIKEATRQCKKQLLSSKTSAYDDSKVKKVCCKPFEADSLIGKFFALMNINEAFVRKSKKELRDKNQLEGILYMMQKIVDRPFGKFVKLLQLLYEIGRFMLKAIRKFFIKLKVVGKYIFDFIEFLYSKTIPILIFSVIFVSVFLYFYTRGLWKGSIDVLYLGSHIIQVLAQVANILVQELFSFFQNLYATNGDPFTAIKMHLTNIKELEDAQEVPFVAALFIGVINAFNTMTAATFSVIKNHVATMENVGIFAKFTKEILTTIMREIFKVLENPKGKIEAFIRFSNTFSKLVGFENLLDQYVPLVAGGAICTYNKNTSTTTTPIKA